MNSSLAIVVSWCANKKGTRKKSQTRLKSDLGLRLFGISARENNEWGIKWAKQGSEMKDIDCFCHRKHPEKDEKWPTA